MPCCHVDVPWPEQPSDAAATDTVSKGSAIFSRQLYPIEPREVGSGYAGRKMKQRECDDGISSPEAESGAMKSLFVALAVIGSVGAFHLPGVLVPPRAAAVRVASATMAADRNKAAAEAGRKLREKRAQQAKKAPTKKAQQQKGTSSGGGGSPFDGLVRASPPDAPSRSPARVAHVR